MFLEVLMAIKYLTTFIVILLPTIHGKSFKSMGPNPQLVKDMSLWIGTNLFWSLEVFWPMVLLFLKFYYSILIQEIGSNFKLQLHQHCNRTLLL